ncbi:MAG: NAD(+)/NADH kinase [Terriglobales bacterium]
MKTVAIVSKPEKPELTLIVPEVLRWLDHHGYNVVVDMETSNYLPGVADVVPREQLTSRRPELMIVLGGDGTLLSGARAVAPLDTCILGINLGSLGFLAEVPLSELHESLEAVHAGHWQTDDRSMIYAKLVRGDKMLSDFHALNDAILSKSTIARLVSFDIFINREFVTSFRGDGLIVATPTGSTAYSLAAGGPILTPSAQALVISPICPHALTHRPVVVPDSAEIEILVQSADDEAYLSIDGQIGIPVQQGDKLVCRKSPYVTHLIRLRTTFFEVLRTKLKWGEKQ